MKDNVYRVTAEHYRSVFMVTDEGLFPTDPISDDAATWLRDELAERFDMPIRYLASLNALYAAVRDRMVAGKTLDQLQAEIHLPPPRRTPSRRNPWDTRRRACGP